MDYKEAGCDIEKIDLFFEKIKKIVTSTYSKDVVSGVGGIAALYEIDEDRFLASGTDGVGTNWIWKFSCDLVEGIAAACKEVKCALVGGETAEMEVYAEGVYDLAGFCVGEVMKEN